VRKIKIHAKVVMFGTLDDIQFLAVRVVSLCEPSQEVGNNSGVFVTKEEVDHIPANSQLLVIDDFVGNTWIIRIDFKTQRNEVSNKFSIK